MKSVKRPPIERGRLTGDRIARSGVVGLCMLGAGAAAPTLAQDESAATTVEEIVVTAQRRAETLQKVPISITALSGEQVSQLNVNKAADLSAISPGVFAAGSRGDANPIFAIRGIGLNDSFANNNPTVGVYIDEIVQPFTPLLGFPVFDLERIEVLKGPQGTLYGRNTTGGAINFISKRPTQELDAYTTVSYGRFERAEIEGAIGGGLTDTLALRVAGKITDQGSGWQTNALTGEKIGEKDSKALRALALWTPTDDVEVLFKASVLDDRSDLQLREHVGYNSPGGGICSSFYAGKRDEGNCVNALGYYDHTPGRRSVESSELYGHVADTDSRDFLLNVDWNLGAATLTSVTGYIDFDRVSGDDSDGSALVLLDSRFHDKIEAFSQEVRLASNGDGDFTWMVGAYYSWDELSSDIDQALDDHFFRTRVSIDALQTTTSYALFTQLQYRLTDRLRLTGGLRYTEEKKEFEYDAFDTDPFGTSAGLPTPVAGIDDVLREDVVTGKIGLDFDLTEDVMLYASASKGFKSGGYKSAIAFQQPELDPFYGEDLYAYEIGAKTTWLDGRLQLNSALYYYDYQDFQAFVTEIRSGLNVIVLNNAGDAEVYGLEVDATARPTDRLLVRLSANYMSTEITKINPDVQADYLGNRLANAPEVSATAIVRYDLPTENFGFGSYVMLDGSYRDKTYYSVNNRGQSSQDAFGLLNARIGFTSPDERWEFALWGRNLTDKLYVSSSYDNFGGIFPSQNFLGDPRTYGVSATFKY